MVCNENLFSEDNNRNLLRKGCNENLFSEDNDRNLHSKDSKRTP